MIEVQIKNETFKAMIDSGSEINCVSEELYLTQFKDVLGIMVLPVTNVFLKLATGKRSKRIGLRLQVELVIQQVEIPFECFVVPDLVFPIIIGSEFGYKYGGHLQWNKKIFQFNFQGEIFNCPFIINPSYGINFIRKQEPTPVSLQSVLTEKLGNMEECKRNRLINVMLPYSSIFEDRLGLTNKYEHRILMSNETPFVKRSYPISFALRSKVDLEIKRMEDLGVIRREASPYSSPMTVVKKKDDTVRICLDARYLNASMVNDIESPPPMDELIQKFHGKKFLTIIDLKSSYWQIPLAPESHKYTAFLYNSRSYVYLVLPFGLKTAVGSFSRAMDQILGPEVREFVTNYVDDLLVASTDFDSHVQHLKIVFSRLQEANITINLKKTEFFKPQVKFLGFILSEKGILPDPEKIEAINKFPTPRKQKDIRAFLGACNFYRRFQKQFSSVARVLQDLLRKDVPWRWGLQEQNAFDKLKEFFLSCVMLSHPDPKLSFILQTDSSDLGLGGVLYQVNHLGEELVITFISRSFQGPELRYTTTEKELLAVIHCLKKVKLYLLGRKFVIKTDHQALQFLKPHNALSDRLIRWMLYLQNFDFEFVHVKGVDNHIPDLLSRKPFDQDVTLDKKTKEFVVALLPIDNKDTVEKKLKQIGPLQIADPFFSKVINEKTNGYSQENGILYRVKIHPDSKVICLPFELLDQIVLYLHQELGHAGTGKTYSVLQCYFYRKNLYKEVKRIVRCCDLCQKSKYPNRNFSGPMNPIIPEGIGALVAVDFFGPLPASTFGVTYIFVVLDTFSKFVQLYPLRRATTNAAAKKLLDYNQKLTIKTVLADHGSQFKSARWHDILNKNNIRSTLTSVNHPASNPAERVMREIGRFLRAYCYKHHQGWYKLVPDLEDCLNSIPHDSTGFCAIIVYKTPKNTLGQIFIKIE